MLKEFIAATKMLTGCQAAALRILDKEGNIPYALEEGFDTKFCEVENFLSVERDHGLCVQVVRNDIDPTNTNFTEHGSYFIQNLPPDDDNAAKGPASCLRNTCNRFGYQSLTLVPIKLGNQILGLIHAADRRENIFNSEIVEMLEAAERDSVPVMWE